MNTIVELRKAQELTQYQLAVKAGIHPSGLARIENGGKCNQATAARIATALGEKPEVVFPTFKELRGW
ncbi:MAG: helix-turn-helix transcriptional regulator [Limnospira sp. PMC 737.11]|uniref:helix-turn-helix domain-containing protein n=1 Tax=unclassified Limnospira TaxID=2642885 RepID=UPI0028E1381B|nr:MULTISPECIES: helix-turn-helix transcriptional regulator [unclassified Limnospira]MDT9267281.1 helix-turn-helix transcriptional regulator [Limnospira sp. PMC 1223.20]MDT9277468.1 helix-turn-helix transcriptional regulator [Limnospira sp. PMC 737.11]